MHSQHPPLFLISFKLRMCLRFYEHSSFTSDMIQLCSSARLINACSTGYLIRLLLSLLIIIIELERRLYTSAAAFPPSLPLLSRIRTDT